MKIILITPGTGSYYCGVCMRDNALAKELIRQGHDAVMLPMYLPLTLDESSVNSDIPIFYGGINVYLQQKFAFFRNAPRWLDRLFNHPALLRLVGKKSGMTGGAEIGELTHSMLMGEEGKQARELEKLLEWLVEHGRPDTIWLSTALLVGLSRSFQETLGIPVLCSLQGEDSFLDGLDEPWRSRCWEALANRSRDVNRFIAPSQYFSDLMAPRMRLLSTQLQVIPNGLDLDGFEPSSEPPTVPTIGYLARMIEGKGLGLMVDAFILLKKTGRHPTVRLRCAGAMTSGDELYVEKLKQRLTKAGCLEAVEFLPNVSKEEKIAFFKSLTLFSVPATYSEAFGLYLVEAMAAGVPVVQPRSAAFPEIVEATGGGLLCEPQSAKSLCEHWEILLANPARARELGHRGRAAIEAEYSMPAMARRFVAQTREIIDAQKVAT
jgi:glycosyltransferase involved in cell wall biosynthesis